MSIEDIIKEELKLSNIINDYEIQIGVFEDTEESNENNDKGLNYASILQVLENGSPIRNIQPYPILDLTINQVNKDKIIDEIVDDVVDGIVNKDWDDKDVEKYLNIRAAEIVNWTKETIMKNDGDLPMNKYPTAKRKWMKQYDGKDKKKRREMSKLYKYPAGNHPLLDTGGLVNAITYKVVKK